MLLLSTQCLTHCLGHRHLITSLNTWIKAQSHASLDLCRYSLAMSWNSLRGAVLNDGSLNCKRVTWARETALNVGLVPFASVWVEAVAEGKVQFPFHELLYGHSSADTEHAVVISVCLSRCRRQKTWHRAQHKVHSEDEEQGINGQIRLWPKRM